MTAAGTGDDTDEGAANGDSGESPAAVLAPPNPRVPLYRPAHTPFGGSTAATATFPAAPPVPEPEADPDDDVRWLTRLREACYYGTGSGQRLGDPMRTATTHDRFGLVQVEGADYEIADVGMRMLVPRELYRAQGFPETYEIEPEVNGRPLTKTSQIRMAGNSVAPPVAAALVRAQLGIAALERVA